MFKNIVIPVDLSDKHSINAVFPAALNFVNAFGSKIHLIHIVPDFGKYGKVFASIDRLIFF